MNVLKNYDDAIIRGRRPNNYDGTINYLEVINLPLLEKLEFIFDAESDHYDSNDQYLFGVENLNQIIEMYQSSSPDLEQFANTLLQQADMKRYKQFLADEGVDLTTPVSMFTNSELYGCIKDEDSLYCLEKCATPEYFKSVLEEYKKFTPNSKESVDFLYYARLQIVPTEEAYKQMLAYTDGYNCFGYEYINGELKESDY